MEQLISVIAKGLVEDKDAVTVTADAPAEDGTLVIPRKMRYVPAHARLFHASDTPFVSETTDVNAIGSGSNTAVKLFAMSAVTVSGFCIELTAPVQYENA